MKDGAAVRLGGGGGGGIHGALFVLSWSQTTRHLEIFLGRQLAQLYIVVYNC